MSTDFRFLHAADIHLDSPLQALARYDDSPVEQFREATRQALVGLVDLALESQVDFVLLAGDLYDGKWDESRTGLFLVRQLARLRERKIPVFAIRGNHDAENKMSGHVRFPENVTFFSAKEAETRELPELQVAIHGQSFAQRDVSTNLASRYPNKVAGWFNIGLLHTGLDGREGHALYAPCAISDLLRCGYDYWALGHIHQREIVHPDPLIVFPGNLQGRHIHESGAKGAYVVSVTQGRPEPTFHPLDLVRWRRVELSIDDVPTIDSLLVRFRKNIEQICSEEEGRLIAARVELTGSGELQSLLAGDPTRYDNELRAAALDAGMGNVWLEKIVQRTKPQARARVSNSQSDEAESPFDEIDRVVAEMMASSERIGAFRELFDDLRGKLPSDLGSGEIPLPWSDDTALKELLMEAVPLLHQRLSSQEESR